LKGELRPAVTCDAFGRALLDWQKGGTQPEIIERDDGEWDYGAGHELYLARFDDWPTCERRSMRYVLGPAVDVGCGAGRVALHLQERGIEVVGVDSSALAIRAARACGVKETWCLSLEALSTRIERFRTIVLLGNNFGIFATPGRLRTILADWADRTSPSTRIIAESVNPHGGGAPALDRRHCRLNRQRGRLPGQVRLRTRYEGSQTPWFEWLFVSRAEMRQLLRGTGWRLGRVIGDAPKEPYVAILEKE
jgi:SAM-dependent methyltransferase